jgi:hypothetical protein
VAEIGHSSQYDAGSYPKCPAFQPVGDGFKIKFRTETVSVSEATDVRTTTTTLDGVVTDQEPPCGQRVAVRIPYGAEGGGSGATLNIRPGDVFVMSHRLTLVTDFENLSTDVVLSENGRPLLVTIVGARPGFFDSDLLTGIELKVPRENICRGGAEAHFSLSTGAEECWVNSRSQRCCTLWGRNYVVQSQAAEFYPDPKPGQPWANINIALREEGFVVRK